MKARYSRHSKQDNQLDIDFGRSFAQGLNLSLEYRRSNQVGEWNRQGQRNTGLGIGIWHQAPNGRYNAFYNFISNTAIAQENGGISDPDSIGRPNWPDITIPIFLQSGITTHRQRSLQTRQMLKLLPDTSAFNVEAWLQGKWTNTDVKYADDAQPVNALYYDPVFITDDRGIRQFTSLTEHEWSAGLSLPFRDINSTLQSSIRYRGIRLNQEPDERTINELYFDARGEFQWVEPLRLTGNLSLGLGQAEGSFRFDARGELNTEKVGILFGEWSISGRRPYMIESSLYVNSQLVYEAELRDPFQQVLGVGWKWEEQQLKAGLQWILFDNYIYFNEIPAPVQAGSSVSIRRFYASKTFDLKWLEFSVNGVLQPHDEDYLGLPEWFYQASIAGRLHLFQRKLQVMPGVQITHYSSFSGMSWFPVTGTYHLTGGLEIPEYIRLDAGIGIKVRFLKVYARMDDVIGLFKDRILYHAEGYPHYRRYFRLGVETSFFN